MTREPETDPPPTWVDVFKQLHELWGDAKVGTPYDQEQKLKWAALLEGLEHHAGADWRRGPAKTPLTRGNG